MIDESFQPSFSGSLVERIRSRFRAYLLRARDRRHGSYLPDVRRRADTRYFQLPAPDNFGKWEAVLRDLGENYLAHRFDTLGTGWREVNQKASPTETVNQSNQAVAATIYSLIVGAYTPIDWHCDIKSGYRWRADVWYRDIRYRGLAGVDAKLPWELARMHHLPQLALAHELALKGRTGFREATMYTNEFRNQALDFIAANPPRFGINWCCTMDVAIRASNLLVAHDLFRATGHKFDMEFEKVFWRSMYEHGHHIATNLERHGDIRNNHYLANIAGLLFISAYLPSEQETNSWLAFAARELFSEADYQFHADGSNFESSTSYHRLSAEMLLYGTTLLLALPGNRKFGALPKNIGAQLQAMAAFSTDITSPSGRIVQIGDTDNGRFLKLFPTLENSGEAREVHLDHTSLIAGITALSGETSSKHPEQAFVAATIRERKLTTKNKTPRTHAEIRKEGDLGDFMKRWAKAKKANKQRANFPLTKALDPETLDLAAYPDFGLYIFRAPQLFLAIRCGGENAAHPRGHAHNDQLAVELWIDGSRVIADPGTYVYTPQPEARNTYRSVRAHFTPQLADTEPAALDLGLFLLGPPTGAECLYFAPNGFIGCHRAYGTPIWRAITLNTEFVGISDMADSPRHVLLANEMILANQPPYSHGYGMR